MRPPHGLHPKRRFLMARGMAVPEEPGACGQQMRRPILALFNEGISFLAAAWWLVLFFARFFFFSS